MSPIRKEPKVIQIIPAVGWYAVYDADTPAEHSEPLACWALMDDGEIVGQTAADYVEGANEAGNFSNYRHESQLPPSEPAEPIFG